MSHFEKKFHKARKRYNIHKNEVTRKQLLETSKSYKMVTNQAYKNYQFDFEQKLRNTSKKQGKEFWKILNKFVKNKDEKSEISVETLHDYFKSMNENNVHDEIDIDIDVNNLPPDIEELKTQKLILSCVKPYQHVSKATIARWVKTVLQLAGIDITIYKSHSTRSASTSAAFQCATSIDTILKAAG
ncbi:unnamed protein product [Mytilus edulis]|uniref:Uncharacterized protein n=1 Tax=Mytilus edulis TaxID=6550 RepID=A0A8S3QFJ9_MYTED|nr:unnamed protein product [Mytilus edulis]